jgi:hypothetical protein
MLMKPSQRKAIHAKRPTVTGTSIKDQYFTYNKDGLGGLIITANTKQEAKKKAVEQWGNGATAEFYKKEKYTHVKL